MLFIILVFSFSTVYCNNTGELKIDFSQPENLDKFLFLHPIQFKPTNCFHSQFFLFYSDIRVNYTSKSYYEKKNPKRIKVLYEHVVLPNTILLDYIPNAEKLIEFNVHESNFDQPTFNLGDAAFHTYLEKIQISNSNLEHVVNFKNHCSPNMFDSLFSINLIYNNISFIDGQVFQNMPSLKLLYLIGNPLKSVAYIDQILKPRFEKLYLNEINDLVCSTFHRILYSFRHYDHLKIYLSCNINNPIQCKRISNLTCPDSENEFTSFNSYKGFFTFTNPRTK